MINGQLAMLSLIGSGDRHGRSRTPFAAVDAEPLPPETARRRHWGLLRIVEFRLHGRRPAGLAH